MLIFSAKEGYLVGFPAGLSRPGKSREGPGTRRNRTGPRDLEGPVVLAGQDLETLKVPGLFLKVPGPPGLFFPLKYQENLHLFINFELSQKPTFYTFIMPLQKTVCSRALRDLALLFLAESRQTLLAT